MEGYGPYKPVPPPKPLPQQPNNSKNSNQQPQTTGNGSSLTPPPYRMPPYPLYSEPTPNIPGAAAGLDSQPVATSSPQIQQGLQTHSSKFPIEREVILSSSDKNSKIPILHDYMKRAKASIAPDLPPKQMQAWTQGQQGSQVLSPDQTHPGQYQPNQHNSSQNDPSGLYRATYHSPQDYYNSQNISLSTGAVPRSSWHSSVEPAKPQPRQNYQNQDEYPNHQTVSVQIENVKDQNQKDAKGNKTMTKTYHTIKDMISSKFKSSKEAPNEDKNDTEAGLNNVAEELRKSTRNVDRIGNDEGHQEEHRPIQKKTAGEQGIYGKPRTDQNISMAQHQYNQQIKQQHLLVQHAMQNQHFPTSQQLKTQHQFPHQLVQARSQEILASRVQEQEQLYYQTYTSSPQRPGQRFNMQQQQQQQQQQNRTESYLYHQPQEAINERCVDDRRPVDLRSPQQIERDNLRQKASFEARRAASQPQLAYDANGEVKNEIPDNRPQPQAQTRRGSYGNIMEASSGHPNKPEIEKDSDDGGFLRRNSNERNLENGVKGQGKENGHHEESTSSKDETKVNSALTGTPRKRLEGEIGKIEGVYNVNQRNKQMQDDSRGRQDDSRARLDDSRVRQEDLRGRQEELGTRQEGVRGRQEDLRPRPEDPRSRKQTAAESGGSDYDKAGQSSSNADSGRGSAAYSSGRRPGTIDTSNESSEPIGLPGNNYRDQHQGHDSDWVDIVENELRHILEPKLHELSLHGNNVANSTLSESISSMTPPLPPLSPGEQSSPNVTPRNSARYKHSSLPYGSKPDYDNYNKSKSMGQSAMRWHNNVQKHRNGKKMDHSALMRGKQMFGLDTTDLTSTTTRSMDLESMLDGQSDSEGDISTADARAIRKQLEGLESMYSEVLKFLGVKKHQGGRYQPSDPRFSKRRYGSMSSLPSSSVSSRPIRDKRRGHEERKKVRDMRGINKRFQRLESHVVTLARSVAHLSSEMRTQHLMIQEMENIRGEIAALRTQTNMLNVRSQSASRGINTSKDLPDLANPTRVKKLTKFFGDEPPLLRLFLRKLGYEKYANVFENERVGMVELPYLSEERLQKMGLPLGPRLRIMQEAQISVCKDNTLCIV